MEEEKLNLIVCLIKFVVILDNGGKLIYAKYFDIEDPIQQREFEKKLCQATQTISVSKDEIDIFSTGDYNVVCKIEKEIAIFIGIPEDENENLAMNFFTIFENVILSLLNENLSRQNVLDNYDKIVIAIDEMINEGIVMNTDGESLEKRVFLRTDGSSGKSFMNFGQSYSSSSSTSGGLFGSWFSGARNIFGS